MLFYGGIITNLLEYVVRWFTSFMGKIAQVLCGVVFNGMETFMASTNGHTLTEDILKPVYTFSKNYLRPLGIELLLLIIAWNLLIAMFGKYSANQDDPFVLVGRGIFFCVLIVYSVSFIGLVSNNLINPLVSLMYTTESKSQTAATKQVSSWEDNGWKGVNKILGTSGLSSSIIDGDDDITSDSFQNGGAGDVNTQNTDTNEAGLWTDEDEATVATVGTTALGLTLISASTGLSSFAVVIIGLIIYFAVYGFMVLYMVFQAFGICWKFIQRQVSFYVILYMAPLAFSCGPSKSTQRVFAEWCKMIATYGLTMVLTAGFLRISQEVIFLSFKYSGSPNIIKTAMSFGIAIAFIKMIKNMEQYVDRLGLSAVGWNDRNFLGMALSQAVGRSLSYGFMGTIGQASKDFIGNMASSNIQFKGHNLFAGKNSNRSVADVLNTDNDSDNNGVFGLMKENGNAKNMLDTDEGVQQYGLGEDGMMHELDENGNAIDGATLKDNGAVFSDVNDPAFSTQVNGYDDLSTLTGVDSLDDKVAVENPEGDYFMGDGGVAVPKNSIDSDEFFDENGNEWNGSGSKYGVTTDGSKVNLGNGQTYDLKNAGTYYKDANGNIVNQDKAEKLGLDNVQKANQRDAYYMTSKDANAGFYNSNTNSVIKTSLYNESLPVNANIADVSKLKFTKMNQQSYQDGSVSGIVRQSLDDGTSCCREYKMYRVNETNKDEIMNLEKSHRSDPAYGYTPDGKYFIQLGDVLKGRKYNK
jgi:hypothetical protein